jgi:hypothetical protein
MIEEICTGTIERYGYYPKKPVEVSPKTVKNVNRMDVMP